MPENKALLGDCRASQMASKGTKLTMKLLVNTDTNKVLLAEASKEVVDFLFGLLEIPIGSAVKILTTQKMSGSFGNLFQSVEALDATYLQSTHVKTALLNPVVPRSTAPSHELLLLPSPTPSASGPKQYFRCLTGSSYYPKCPEYISSTNGVTCPSCRNLMTGKVTMVQVVDSKQQVGGGGQTPKGYVKELVTYTITDDLSVTPMSTISSITLLNKFNVKDVGVLEETTVQFGFDEGLELLKASLQSKTVLSDVFLSTPNKSGKKRNRR